MTAEKAVEIIKNLPVVRWENACVNHSDLYEALSMALKALERQIPKKPEKVEEHLYCPICDSFIGYVVDCKEEHYQIPHCQGCGQKIDWENDYDN